MIIVLLLHMMGGGGGGGGGGVDFCWGLVGGTGLGYRRFSNFCFFRVLLLIFCHG